MPGAVHCGTFRKDVHSLSCHYEDSPGKSGSKRSLFALSVAGPRPCKNPNIYVTMLTLSLLPGMTGSPNSFTARGPVTLTAILFPQPAV